MAIERKPRRMVMPGVAKYSMIVFALLLIIAVYRAFEIYSYIFKPNVSRDAVLLIPSGTTFNGLKKIIESDGIIFNDKAFTWVARKKNYRENILPGRYVVKKGWNTNTLVNKLRNGEQDPVRLTFNNIDNFEELAGKTALYLEADSSDMIKVFTDDSIRQAMGFPPFTYVTMFIPNTYEIYWTSSPINFIKRMKEEYKRFWNSERQAKASANGLTPVEAAILASIVQKETTKEEEKPVVAGVYLNRLKRGMPLQADPTVKYALGDSSIRRITRDMLAVDSPYNTYRNTGLPPGPICFPEIPSIDAVLNAANHNYLFMCAKEDFSGFHRFASTLAEHNQNAAKYQQALNQNKIWR